MKKQIFVIIIILALLLTACSAPVPAPKATPEPTAATMQTPEPTPTLSQEPTPTQTVNVEIFEDSNDLLQGWPDLEGARKGIVEINGNEKGVYIAEVNNPWGIEEGKEIGGYNKNVFVDGKKIGGYYLISKVVESISLKANGGFFIPLDISDSDSSVDINITPDVFEYSLDGFSLDFVGSLPLICPSYGKENIKTDYVLYQDSPNGEVYLRDSFMIYDEYRSERIGVNGLILNTGRDIKFKGEFDIDIQSFTKDIHGFLSLGYFEFGEKICNVEGELYITGGCLNGNGLLDINGNGIGFEGEIIMFNDEKIPIDSALIFLCQDN